MNYFVIVSKVEILSNLTKEQAINAAKSEYNKRPEKGMLNIGVGRLKFKNDKLVYTNLPLYYFL